DWLKKKHSILSPVDVRLPVISSFLAHEKERGLAAASLKLVAVAIKIFFRFLKSRSILAQDPAELLPLPRLTHRLPETLNPADIERLLATSLDQRPFPHRDRAILELLYASGLRISELANARLDNLNLQNRIIRVIGKGSKMRLVPVGKKACVQIERYLREERIRLAAKRTANEIFLSRLGRKLTTQRIWQIVKETAELAGLDQNVYPHLFRHSFATHLLANGADLRIIQELLGHADIATTEIYTHVDQSGLKALHKRFHPRG
ncbi:MAG: tyrosine recombinase, partial [Verrucomicrobia bacterium]|nr:tyrosine recombinase [Verrucomicrobiota bacterium]